MFKFFRNFRKKLIEQDNIRRPASPAGRYLLYATGEILLVVIGILIALQINNLNEERKNRAYERTMLEEVLKELISDSEKIEYWIPTLKSVQHSFRELTVMKNDPRHSLDSLEYHLNIVRRYGITLTFNKSPFEAIKSGGLDRIRNQEIRNNLSNLYGFHIEDTEEWINEVLRVELFNRYEIEYELFDPVAVKDEDGNVITEITIDNPTLLFENPMFDELLYRSSWQISGTIRRLSEVHDKMEILGKQITKELNI
jgi:vacuolar-type H+-ATPase subunit I/STV1